MHCGWLVCIRGPDPNLHLFFTAFVWFSQKQTHKSVTCFKTMVGWWKWKWTLGGSTTSTTHNTGMYYYCHPVEVDVCVQTAAFCIRYRLTLIYAALFVSDPTNTSSTPSVYSAVFILFLSVRPNFHNKGSGSALESLRDKRCTLTVIEIYHPEWYDPKRIWLNRIEKWNEMEKTCMMLLCAAYLTGIFLSNAVTGTKHSGSDQVAVRANTGLLADQVNIHLLKHITGTAWRRGQRGQRGQRSSLLTLLLD